MLKKILVSILFTETEKLVSVSSDGKQKREDLDEKASRMSAQ